jgi:hypothetical protein
MVPAIAGIAELGVLRGHRSLGRDARDRADTAGIARVSV